MLLTGDFLTMEGSGTRGALTEALAPLRRRRGRAYAVFGNHDHDRGAPAEVHAALTANGVRILMDEEVAVATPAGPVQIVGADYVGKGRREHIQRLLQAHPRRERTSPAPAAARPQHLPSHPARRGRPHALRAHPRRPARARELRARLDGALAARAGPTTASSATARTVSTCIAAPASMGFPLRIGVPGEASLLEIVV